MIVTAAVGCGGRFETAETSDAGNDANDAASDTLVSGCPVTGEPKAGTPCAPDGVFCDTGKCSAPEWRGGSFYSCDKGIWQVGVSTCNPPPPETPCPASEPTVGGACSGYYAKDCSYPDKCPTNPTDYGSNDYRCNAGVWQLTSPDYVAPCPASEPTSGASCDCAPHMKLKNCDYRDCYGIPVLRATCSEATKTWSILETSCNPPPPPMDAGSP
jgi:hypothetical protein